MDAESYRLYRRVVGQLLWLVRVRPGMSYMSSELSRALQSPAQDDDPQGYILRSHIHTVHWYYHQRRDSRCECVRGFGLVRLHCDEKAYDGMHHHGSRTSYP